MEYKYVIGFSFQYLAIIEKVVENWKTFLVLNLNLLLQKSPCTE